MKEYFFDLGKMSDDKADLIEQAMKPGCPCPHPDSAHTLTEATWPWRICARYVPAQKWVLSLTARSHQIYEQCGCQILGD